METISYFEFIIYFLGSILLLVLICLGIRLMITLNKVDKLVDDITDKSKSLDGLFGTIDKLTDAVSSVNDKVISLVFNSITAVTKKLKKKKERTDEDE